MFQNSGFRGKQNNKEQWFKGKATPSRKKIINQLCQDEHTESEKIKQFEITIE